ncbi:MAG: thiamine pyrophosphate-binding protein [Acidimicrobiales bacterium]
MGSAADNLALALKRCGSDLAFGVPGGGPNLDVVGALNDHGIRFVLAHSETSSCIMASVYGLLTGRIAAAVVTRGPGAAAAVNGAAQATLDRHPMVLVTDTVPSATADRVPHQRIAQRAMLGPVCKASTSLGAETTVDQLTERIDLALAEPPGTVHFDYDTTASESTSDELACEGLPNHADESGLIDTAKALLTDAEYPVVILGLGAPTDPDRVERLRSALERLGAPVLTTYQAVGVIASENHQAAGLFTNGASERKLLERADLFVTIGLDVVEPIPAAWDYQAPVLSLVTNPTLDPYMPIDVELLGDPVDLAELLLVDQTRWEPDVGAIHRQTVRKSLANGGLLDTDADALGPLEVVRIAAEAAPADTITTVDAGAHFLAIMPFWPVAEPQQLLISNGLATMGYAVPAAIATGLARPGRPVLCFVGDGGLGMTLAELETIARLELPVTVVVFNDSALSLIRIKQQSGHGGSDAVSYRFTDFAAMAPALGLDGVAVNTQDELADALRHGWDRPRLIDARIDPEPYAHLISVTRG